MHLLFLTFSFFLGSGVHAQDSNELLTLVFDAVPIELITTSDTIPTLSVKELANLPVGKQQLFVSEYLASRLDYPTENREADLMPTLEEYEKRISRLELEGGAYSIQLSQEYFTLGTLYQSIGEYGLSIEYLEKAIHNNRLNLGLFNLDQEQIIYEKIKTYVAKGDMISADKEQEYLFFIRQRALGSNSVEMLHALEEYAAWSMFAFDSKLILNPSFSFAAQSHAFISNGAGNIISTEDFKSSLLVRAQIIYQTIIDILLKNYGKTDRRLPDMEKNLALTNYFVATNFDISNSTTVSRNTSPLSMNASEGFYDFSSYSTNSSGYRLGREALESRLAYILAIEDISPEEIAQARIELADWLLIFKKRAAAIETYELAYQALLDTGATVDTLESLFNPPLPVAIPTFVEYRYTRASLNIPDEQALSYQGWFDIKIELSRYGQTRDIEIIRRSDDSSNSVENALLMQLRNSTSFRPRIVDGLAISEDVLLARYYYSY